MLQYTLKFRIHIPTEENKSALNVYISTTDLISVSLLSDMEYTELVPNTRCATNLKRLIIKELSLWFTSDDKCKPYPQW